MIRKREGPSLSANTQALALSSDWTFCEVFLVHWIKACYGWEGNEWQRPVQWASWKPPHLC